MEGKDPLCEMSKFNYPRLLYAPVHQIRNSPFSRQAFTYMRRSIRYTLA